MTTKEYGTKEMERDFGVLTFGRALWAHRKCEEITQQKFAAMLGISPQSLCDIEKGRRIPSPKRVSRIANKINEPEKFWLRLSFQDMLRKENLDYKVSVA